jgi:outer membrane receptor protein involved in Fe transport
MRWLETVMVCGGLAVAMATGAGAQQARGVVAGVVSDSTGRPVFGAAVDVVDTDIRAMTNTAGRYVLPGVWPGRTAVRVRRVGFAPEVSNVTVTTEDTTRADFTLGTVAALPTTQVSAEANRGKMAEFNERRSRGVGLFVTRDEIERRRPASMSEMLRNLPGVTVSQRLAGGAQPVHMDRSAVSSKSGVCRVQLYVDGLPYPEGNVDDFPPETVEGVEVFRGASEIPAGFRTRDAGCGLISIWTRDPAAAARSP